MAEPARAAVKSDAVRAAPAWLAEALTWPPVTSEPLRSSHFSRPHLAETRVNPEARAAYIELAVDTELPLGTRIVQSHRDAATRKPGPVLAVTRSADGWEFALFDSTGSAPDAVAPGYCQGCHEGARSAPIFGLAAHPRSGELNEPTPRSNQ